ncbi:SusC/RagA family TonB-linked outer membrane protein [Parapedobacter soli]|uniref:SusC/RagA family TonB-linked outer membrane protein n=1 Tax=Parapedobacter soli TaxID=416955 RepID=UPI0021CA5952|nr:TonB-dependent receptor [Parapedobacter soli]
MNPNKKMTDRVHLSMRWMVCGVVALLWCMSSTARAQSTTVNGQVTSEAGEVLAGVTVSDASSTNKVITDADGNYSIAVSNPNTTLIFSYVGYKEVRAALNGRTRLNMALEEDSRMVDEVVVIGYGTTRKSDLTGSVSSIKSEALEKFPASNVTEMLRGQAAGIHVSSNNTAPGGASNILVRGGRSLSGGQTPLFLVDGMIVPHLNDLNANDIASIEVLKDASAQAIYGSRASNGVILVTTKRGTEGKASVDVSSYVGFQNYDRNFDLYNPQEFVDLRFWAKYNEGTSGVGTPDNPDYATVIDDAIMHDAYVNSNFVDWERLMLTNAPQHKHDVSLRGGSHNLKYAASLGYLDQDGIVSGSGFQRGNFRSNVDYSPADWFDIGVNMSFARSAINSVDANFNGILTMPQLAQAFDADGNLMREANTAGDINPLWRVREYNAEQTDDYFVLASTLTFKPFAHFSYSVRTNLRTNNRESGDYRTKRYPSSTGMGQLTQFARNSFLIENVINYDVPFANSNHRLQATLIHAFEQDLQKTLGMNFINSTTDIFDWNVVGDAEISGPIRSINRNRSISYAGRLQYSLMDKYLLTASVRRDGASVFGSTNKWANFPSLAAAWRLDQESFFQDVSWLSQLKARVSYGVVGNWAIPAYRTLGLSTSYEYLFGDALSIGYLPSNQLMNKDLKWETTHSVNYGLDFGFFRNRITGSVEYYNTRTKDLLIQRTVPSITGYNTMWDNLGETKSSGFEVTVNGDIMQTRDFDWTAGVTFSRQRNSIVKIDGRLDENGKPIDDLSNNWFVGSPIDVAYNYVFGGIWQTGETPQENQYLPGDAAPKPGDIKIFDYNGDGQITTDDRKIFNLMPDWYATFQTAFWYKNFDAQFEFYTVQGVDKSNPYLYGFNEGGSLNGKKNGIKVDYWTENNPSNTAPRPQFTASVPYMGILAMQDASYFRLRTATLGFTLPQQWTSKIQLKRARIYATATNIFTQTKYQSYSPEKTPGGYPEPKMMTFGANLSF